MMVNDIYPDSTKKKRKIYIQHPWEISKFGARIRDSAAHGNVLVGNLVERRNAKVKDERREKG